MKVNNSTSNPIASGESTGSHQAGRAADAKKTDRTSAAQNTGPGKALENNRSNALENTTISPQSREFAQAKVAAAEAPDVREDRIAELKKRIDENNYDVDSKAVADRLVDDHLKMGMS